MTARRGPVASKQETRDRLLVRRRARSPQERTRAGHTLAAVLRDAPEVAAARTVAAYVSVGTEPPTDRLLAELRERGTRVLLPVLRDDLDLDWAEYAGEQRLVAGPRRTRHPDGPTLGLDAVGDVDVLLCPGLAVDDAGVRLGRGGGSFDRALARTGGAVWSCVLLFSDEVEEDVPVEAHDHRVRAAATPDGIVRFG